MSAATEQQNTGDTGVVEEPNKIEDTDEINIKNIELENSDLIKSQSLEGDQIKDEKITETKGEEEGKEEKEKENITKELENEKEQDPSLEDIQASEDTSKLSNNFDNLKESDHIEELPSLSLIHI